MNLILTYIGALYKAPFQYICISLELIAKILPNIVLTLAIKLDIILLKL